jgi:hypothetical protein
VAVAGAAHVAFGAAGATADWLIGRAAAMPRVRVLLGHAVLSLVAAAATEVEGVGHARAVVRAASGGGAHRGARGGGIAARLGEGSGGDGSGAGRREDATGHDRRRAHGAVAEALETVIDAVIAVRHRSRGRRVGQSHPAGAAVPGRLRTSDTRACFDTAISRPS